jgi:hypothetical protein
LLKSVKKTWQKAVKKLLKSCQKVVKKLSKMFVKNVSIIYSFAQIVRRRRRRRRRRRLVAPRPGGDFVAPGKNSKRSEKMMKKTKIGGS